jgi:glycosyltransferase involved in cell wall biosynthesis
MMLSILTPAVPSRMAQIGKLCAELEKQIGGAHVEHLVLIDNKRRTVGEKRDALLRAARGRYVAFVDDDDWITPDYVTTLIECAKLNPDVITFWQAAEYNGLKSEVKFKLGNDNEQFNPGGITKRNAWHICAWRRSLAIQSQFPASNYGEDWAWAAPLCGVAGLREAHVEKVIHYYTHNAETTEAPEPK